MGEKIVAYCDKCEDEIYEDEIYGICDGRVTCGACRDNEWDSLSEAEKFDRLGYDVVGLHAGRVSIFEERGFYDE